MARKTFTFDGKRYEVTAKTEAEAITKMALKKRDLEEGRTIITKNTSLKQWTIEWLESYKQPTVDDGWYENVVYIVNSKIISDIGNMKLSQIKPLHIQKLLNKCTIYADSYLTKIYNILHEIFDAAKFNQLIIDNPVDGIKRPRGNKKGERRSLTEYERKYVISLCQKHRAGLFIMFILYCGLRPGEVAALQFKNINLMKRTIKIDSALKSNGTIGDPKSAAGFRAVFIPEEFAEYLKLIQGNPYDYACVQVSGHRHTTSSIRQMWKSFIYKLNIEMGCKTYKGALIPPYRVADDLVMYCFRHTYCTDLQAAGIPINVARELMGHEDISTTAKIYTHSSEASFNNAADAMNEYNNKRSLKTDVDGSVVNRFITVAK